MISPNVFMVHSADSMNSTTAEELKKAREYFDSLRLLDASRSICSRKKYDLR